MLVDEPMSMGGHYRFRCLWVDALGGTRFAAAMTWNGRRTHTRDRTIAGGHLGRPGEPAITLSLVLQIKSLFRIGPFFGKFSSLCRLTAE